MNVFRARLEARNPERDCQRWYRVEIGTDLFGVWVVEIGYGRIGTAGHRVRYFSHDEETAKRLVRRILQRRATARKRIGVDYLTCEWDDPDRWVWPIHINGFPVNVDGVVSAGK